MMKYTVVITHPAEIELATNAQWWAEHRSVDQAIRWYEGFLAAIQSLERNPDRCPLARENDRFDVEIRELHYGLGGRPTHRAVFNVEGNRVLVLTVRHGAQRDLTDDDL
jgi:plasmid stabilization system protein ParE